MNSVVYSVFRVWKLLHDGVLSKISRYDISCSEADFYPLLQPIHHSNLFSSTLSDWIKSLFFKEEMELTLVGLQNSGKTTFVNVIAVCEVVLAHLGDLGVIFSLLEWK